LPANARCKGAACRGKNKQVKGPKTKKGREKLRQRLSWPKTREGRAGDAPLTGEDKDHLVGKCRLPRPSTALGEKER